MRRWLGLLAVLAIGCAEAPVDDTDDTGVTDTDDTGVTDTDDTDDTDDTAVTDTDDTDDTAISDPAPDAPQSPGARATGTTSAQVLWVDASDDETAFRVERDGGTGFVEVAQAAAGATSFADTGLVAGGTYAYRVFACRGTTCSAPSPEASVTLPTAKAPAAPDDLAVVALNSSEIGLDWNDNAADETAYVIAWSDDQGLTFEEYPDLPANTQSATDGGLADGTTYCYRVRAKNSAATSPWSGTGCATTLAAGPPGAPTALQATHQADGRILLTWTNPDSNTGYKVYESVNAGVFGFVGTVTPGNLAGAYVAGLAPSTSYAYKVAATNGFGDSPQSVASNTVTTPGSSAGTWIVVQNASVYPMVSLVFDGTERFPSAPLGIPAGESVSIAVAAGSHTYAAQNGFWSGGARTTLYSWSGTTSINNGQVLTVALDDPTVTQILTRFGSSGSYVGEYWSGTALNWKRLRFFPNGTYTLENNGVAAGGGTYALLAYNGNFLVSFRLTGAGGGDALLDERTGSFFLRNGPNDWPTIQYGYDGP